jgi:hypothetical protein
VVLIAEILVVDEPDAWRDAGFAVGDDGVCRVGTVAVRVVPRATGGRRAGIAGWTLAGLVGLAAAGGPAGGTIDGLPTAAGEVADPPDGPPTAHPNGCTSIDHVVAMTPDLDRTTAALAAAGLEARRTREAGTGPDGVTRLQRFFRLGEVILELVGPAAPPPGAAGEGGDRPARFWGLAHTVADLDATAARLGDRLSPPRDAVQPGRRIASLRREAGLAVPTAFLTPDRRHPPS